jgi:hypothetical protein
VRWPLLLLFAGCASQPAPTKEVERTEVPHDLSGEWNDTDADLVALAIIQECLASSWPETWTQAHGGKKPVIRLYPIRNRTTGYIDYRYFTKQIEAALVRSGRLDVIAGLDEVRSSDGSDGEVGDTGAEMGRDESGADFVLNGWVLSQEDQEGSREVRAYLTSIEIIEVASQKKAWVGQKKIRKLITSK